MLHHFDPATADLTVPVLVEALRGAPMTEQQRAVAALGRIGAPAAEALIKLLGKDNPNSHRSRAATALAAIGPDAAPAADALIAALNEPRKGDYHLHVRSNAARALGYIGARSDKVVAILTEMLRDRHVRRGAAEALHLLAPSVNRRHMGLSVKALSRGDWWSRRDAAVALGRMGAAASSAAPALGALAFDHDSAVRAAAAEALRKIRGRPLPFDEPLAHTALPGSWLPINAALERGCDFVAVCQATGDADVINETGRLCAARQRFVVLKTLAGRARAAQDVDLDYLYHHYRRSGRAVRKGHRVVCIVRKVRPLGGDPRRPTGELLLIAKAVPDTPANRAAVAGR